MTFCENTITIKWPKVTIFMQKGQYQINEKCVRGGLFLTVLNVNVSGKCSYQLNSIPLSYICMRSGAFVYMCFHPLSACIFHNITSV